MVHKGGKTFRDMTTYRITTSGGKSIPGIMHDRGIIVWNSCKLKVKVQNKFCSLLLFKNLEVMDLRNFQKNENSAFCIFFFMVRQIAYEFIIENVLGHQGTICSGKSLPKYKVI